MAGKILQSSQSIWMTLFKISFSRIRYALATVRWATPRMFAVGCMGALILASLQYMSTPDAQALFSSHTALCGDRNRLRAVTSPFDKDLLAIEIHDSGFNHFLLSGRIEFSEKTRATRLIDVERMMLELVPMPYGGPVDLGIPNYIELPFAADAAKGGKSSAYIKLPDQMLPVHGDVQRYPFDTYWIGFEPKLLVLHKGKSEYERYPLDAALTDARMSNAFDVIRAPKEDEYLTASDRASSEALQRDADSRQCGFYISRSPWYRAMVVCLAMLVLSPAIFVLYKLESDPGLGLISAVIGVASIRTFLLGSSVDWHFYRIDIVFAFAVVLVAVIPLWRQSSKYERRKILRAKRAAAHRSR